MIDPLELTDLRKAARVVQVLSAEPSAWRNEIERVLGRTHGLTFEDAVLVHHKVAQAAEYYGERISPKAKSFDDALAALLIEGVRRQSSEPAGLIAQAILRRKDMPKARRLHAAPEFALRFHDVRGIQTITREV